MESYRARFRGAPSLVREARDAVTDYARLCGFTSRDVHDIEIAVGEALANAVEHGAKNLGFITVLCSYNGRCITIEVQDEGTGFDYAAKRSREPHAVRGFGITIMRSLMDEVRFLHQGNVVRLSKIGPLPDEVQILGEEEA